MKKTILTVMAFALSLTCSFAGNETKSNANATDAKEAKAPEMDEQGTMAIYPYADRNGTPVHPLDDGLIPTQSRVYFATTACRTWWLSQPLDSGATNDTYFDAGGSANWNSFVISCPF